MGLNIVIGCHSHREHIWFYRGHLQGLESFYREHWTCPGLVVSDDQSDAGEALLDYADVATEHAAWRGEQLADTLDGREAQA